MAFLKKHAYLLTGWVLFSIFFTFLPGYYERSEGLRQLSLSTRDLFFKIRRAASGVPRAAELITFVAIDEASSSKVGSRWPWSRTIFAQLIRQLAKDEAAVIALNLTFTGLERENETASADLAQAAASHPAVIVGSSFSSENRLVKPLREIAENVSGFGYLEKIIDPDYTIRRSYLLRPYQFNSRESSIFAPLARQRYEGSFPLTVAKRFMETGREGDFSFDGKKGRLRVDALEEPFRLNPDGSYSLNYFLAAEDIRRLPAWRVLEARHRRDLVRGKIVLVGVASALFGDMHPTPLGMMPGTLIHANEIIALLAGRDLSFVPTSFVFFWSWFLASGVFTLYVVKRFWLGFVGTVAAFFGVFLLSQFLISRDTVAEPFILILGVLLATLAGIIGNSVRLLLENRGLETKVIHDKMTGLYKYDHLRECLDEEWKRCQRSKVPVSVVMTDLDRFKGINDAMGHEAGNEMIKRAARVIKESARRYDIVARYGGDEFVILLWRTSAEEAAAYKKRLREMYQTMATALNEPLLRDSSISIGVATYDPNRNAGYPPDPQRLIEDADKDLLTDKENRRRGPGRRWSVRGYLRLPGVCYSSFVKKPLKETQIATHRQARRDYHILDTYEAGLVLKGWEVKSLREGKANLAGSFARLDGLKAILYNLYIAPYEKGNEKDPDPLRIRQLLLHKFQIQRIYGKLSQKGLTLIPLRVYFNKRGIAKVELALAKSKTHQDRRDEIKKRASSREIDRVIKSRTR